MLPEASCLHLAESLRALRSMQDGMCEEKALVRRCTKGSEFPPWFTPTLNAPSRPLVSCIIEWRAHVEPWSGRSPLCRLSCSCSHLACGLDVRVQGLQATLHALQAGQQGVCITDCSPLKLPSSALSVSWHATSTPVDALV